MLTRADVDIEISDIHVSNLKNEIQNKNIFLKRENDKMKGILIFCSSNY